MSGGAGEAGAIYNGANSALGNFGTGSMSSYHYSFNNPVMFNDPMGAEGESGYVLPEFTGFQLEQVFQLEVLFL